MFIENTLSGFLFLIAITIYSYKLGIIALLSSLIGTFIAKLGGAEEKSVSQGLFGYNSVLTGIALTLFLHGAYQWIIALVGAAITAFLTAAMMHVFRKKEMPILTFPFIIVTWFMLLSSYQLKTFKLNPDLIPKDLRSLNVNTGGEINWVEGMINGVSQIFLLSHPLSAILFLIGIFWAHWKFGLYTLLGSAIGILLSCWLAAEETLITMGLYGYNAILTILAVSSVFNLENHRYSLFSGIFAASLTVCLTASISAWLIPYGLPTLTMPFVLSTWLFLGARKVLPKY